MDLTSLFFNFGRKKINVSKMAIFQPFVVVLLATTLDIFHKPEIQTVILRCLVCLNLNWIKNYDIVVRISIFSCLKMHHFRGKIPK